MLLFLVRHGKAESGPVDHDRRLTAGGRKAVGRVAKRLAAADVHVSRIEHSGLVRAAETAQILADALHAPLAAVPGLTPEDDVEPVAQRVERAGEEALMLVGHNPFMEALGAYLLTGDGGNELLHVRTSTVLCLSNDGAQWTLEWMLTPDIA